MVSVVSVCVIVLVACRADRVHHRTHAICAHNCAKTSRTDHVTRSLRSDIVRACSGGSRLRSQARRFRGPDPPSARPKNRQLSERADDWAAAMTRCASIGGRTTTRFARLVHPKAGRGAITIRRKQAGDGEPRTTSAAAWTASARNRRLPRPPSSVWRSRAQTRAARRRKVRGDQRDGTGAPRLCTTNWSTARICPRVTGTVPAIRRSSCRLRDSRTPGRPACECH
jgi:hypothetical protein